MPRSSQRDFNQTLMQMVISNHLQNKAQERQRQQAYQQSLAQQALDYQRELAKEQRTLQREIEKKRYDFALDAVKEGNTELASRAISGDLFGASEVQRAQSEIKIGAESGDADLVIKGLRRGESLGGGTLQRLDLSGANAPVAEARKLERQQAIEAEANIEQESRSRGLVGFAEGGAQRLAGYRLGLPGFGPVTAQQLMDEAAALFPNESSDKRRRAVVDAFNRQNKIVGDELRKQRSSEGMTSEQIRREAFATYLDRKRGPDAATAVENPLDLWSREQAGELMSTGNLLEDPVTGGFEMFTAPTQGKKWQEGRLALAELVRLQREVELAFLEASDTTPWYKAGPLTGSQPVQDFLLLFGEQDPAASAYSVLSFRMVSTILKATQGTRPSDFDLRMYMAMLPSLTELKSESGRRKLEVMGNMLSMAANSPFDPSVSGRVKELRSKEWTTEDKRLENALRAYDRAVRSGDAGEIRAAQRRLNVTHSEWSKKRGKDFLVVPNAGQPNVPAGVKNALGDIVGGTP